MPISSHPRPADQLTAAELDRWRTIPVAIAVDVCPAECQIDPAIRPLCAPGTQPRLFGRAVTAQPEPPDFGAVLFAIDVIAPGDVLVIAAGGDPTTAMIGAILSGQLRRNGGRDVAELAGWTDLSVYRRSITPRGPLSAAHGSINAPVTVGGCTIHPGDLIIGDDDGLVVLTPDAVRAFIAAAEAKLAREAVWQASLAAGKSMAETFA
jgi:4-hydroxy-4-methyl-2-oxoglutarate aldolase